MAIASIGNKVSNIKFTSRYDDDDAASIKEKAVAFVNLNDNQVKRLAYLSSIDKNAEKRDKKSALSMLYSLPLVAGLSTAVLKEGNLSTRTVAGAKTAGRWGAGLLALGAYNVIKKAFVSDSKTLQNFQANNPLASTIVDLGIFAAILTAGTKGLQNLENKIFKTAPKTVDKVYGKIQQAKTWLDKTKFNKEMLPKITAKVEKWASKAPWAADAGRLVIANSVFVVLLAGILKASTGAKQKHEKVVNNYRNIKQAQYEVAKKLMNESNEAGETEEIAASESNSGAEE